MTSAAVVAHESYNSRAMATCFGRSALTRRLPAIAFAVTVGAVASVGVSADSWPGSRPQTYASANGAYRFKTQPPRLSTWSGKSTGAMVSVARDGAETTVWSRELVNIPVIAFVADDGASAVTFDTWARLGYEHALVIYGDRGAVVADYDLEALLSSDEISRFVVHTMNARRWLQGATIAFDHPATHIVITLQWGRTIRVGLSTGKIDPP
jgi:hypothetical protein